VVYNKILSLTNIQQSKKKKLKLPSVASDLESFKMDGKKKIRFSSYYERKPFNRKRAIEIHGLTCMCCGFNFGLKYGNTGEGYIQVHHVKPVSELEEAMLIDPKEDLAVLCANCHAMIHKDKDDTMSIQELKNRIKVK
jgi:5-methylcytosine-specific restriction enzyme A